MEKNTVWKQLRKHSILFSVGSLALLLSIFLGVYKVMHSYKATPIARIDPEDSVQTASLPGKLESYKKELMEQEKAAYQRKAALDEIVSIDFSQEMKKGNTLQKTESEKPAKTVKNFEGVASATSQRVNPTLEQHPVTVKPVLKKRKTTHQAAAVKKAVDGFYTIRAENSRNVESIETAAHSFIKAVIHGKQKVKSNNNVCLRLLESATWANHTYPKNTILYGRIRGTVSGRVQITISQVKSSKLHLSVYDQDYREGVAYQMREIVNEVARESRNEALNEVFSSLPYGGIAGGLTQLGRNVTRKTRQVHTIYLADGYQVFIVQATKDN